LKTVNWKKFHLKNRENRTDNRVFRANRKPLYPIFFVCYSSAQKPPKEYNFCSKFFNIRKHFSLSQVPEWKLTNLLSLVYGLNVREEAAEQNLGGQAQQQQQHSKDSSRELPQFPTDSLVKAVQV
jgi:hypothetical protein